MMKRNVIKQILREEVEYEVEENLSPYTKTTTKTSTDISVGLMHKAMNHLVSALRNIEAAIQFSYEADTNNEDLILALEEDGETRRELRQREGEAIKTFFKIIHHLKPSIIAGYNSENFDWHFIVERANQLGIEMSKISKTLGPIPFYRKKQSLKMGPEMEYYEQTEKNLHVNCQGYPNAPCAQDLYLLQPLL